MEYDSGARNTIITKRVWKKIGQPKLRKIEQASAYGNAIKVIQIKRKNTGKIQIKVKCRWKRKVLEAAVVDVENDSFGLSWILVFKLPLPTEVKVNKVKEEKGKGIKRIKVQILKDFRKLFKDDLGYKTRKAKIVIKSTTKKKKCEARVPFSMRKPVETIRKVSSNRSDRKSGSDKNKYKMGNTDDKCAINEGKNKNMQKF